MINQGSIVMDSHSSRLIFGSNKPLACSCQTSLLVFLSLCRKKCITLQGNGRGGGEEELNKTISKKASLSSYIVLLRSFLAA